MNIIINIASSILCILIAVVVAFLWFIIYCLFLKCVTVLFDAITNLYCKIMEKVGIPKKNIYIFKNANFLSLFMSMLLLAYHYLYVPSISLKLYVVIRCITLLIFIFSNVWSCESDNKMIKMLQDKSDSTKYYEHIKQLINRGNKDKDEFCTLYNVPEEDYDYIKNLD